MRIPLPQFSTDNRHPNHFAEVIETTTTDFLAQCLEPEELSFPVMPPFGSWVKSFDEESGNEVLAVVTYVTTTPIDSVHRARALGLSLQDLREEQPQIFAMLKTEFRVSMLGFFTTEHGRNGNGRRGGQCFQYLPPRPPQVHQGVYHCETSEIIRFTEELDFLRILLDVKTVPVDSLLAAVLREVYRLREADREWLVEAGRKLSTLLKDDYDRLRYILSQVHF
ncbi:HerA-ATP synthase, barrel domain protein [Halothece sp. PCC 7418]|uniref:HAS-barrel domain-containing protein n=1 Tax=Halothece sp. (strain PCC 7418) TaxID=65093 RepID=UPI0002A0781A|nr:HAS-barrel domain-containing protein [Halothece sp. PCC 7418]AFZ42430.1 HerA-ATP synthase, barrel domain protein [Halothece sp. PCC 7418]